MTLDALLLLFGLAVLLANRFPADRKNAMGHLFRSYPLERRQYILGKLLGGLLPGLPADGPVPPVQHRRLCAGRALCHCPVGVAAPLGQGPGAVCLSRQLVHRLGGGGAARPWWTSACFTRRRALFFGWNAATVGSAESMPFCLLTAGDLSRLLWVHPKWPGLAWGSVLVNAAFLLGGGVLCACLPFWKLSFWRRRL